MTRPSPSTVRGMLLGALAPVGLWLGLAPALGTMAPASTAATTIAHVDLTRHTNVIVPGEAGSRGSLDVACTGGTVIGGGFSAGRNLRIVESRPHGIRAWRVSWLQTAADDTVAYAYAVCINDVARVPIS